MTDDYLAEWIDKAEEDYQAAIVLIRSRKSPTPNAVCFHCQQSAEKYLKAYLVREDVKFPRTHDLLELHKLCSSIDPGFELIIDLLDYLNPYSIVYRYPGEEVDVEEARQAVKIIKQVRQFVRGVLGLPL
jgi:HEPN domain-containing protein